MNILKILNLMLFATLLKNQDSFYESFILEWSVTGFVVSLFKFNLKHKTALGREGNGPSEVYLH